MSAERDLAWQACERLTRQFYRALDRHEVETIAAMLMDDCQWVRGGSTVTGPEAIRQVLDNRDRGLKTRHLVCNAVASNGADGVIVVDFDLLYVSDAPRPGAETRSAGLPTVLSGTDRYRRSDDGWKLAFKQASLQF